MTSVNWKKWSVILALAALPMGWMIISAIAQDKESPAAQKAVAGSQDADIFTVPDGTPGELIEYIGQLLDTPVEDRSPAGITRHRNRVIDAAVEASSKVFASEQATEQQAASAANIKLQLLDIAARIGKEGASKELSDFKELAGADERKLVRAVLMRHNLLGQMDDWESTSKSERESWLSDFITYLQLVDLGMEHGQFVVDVAMNLSARGGASTALQLVNQAAPLFGADKNPRFPLVVDHFETLARFFGLEGQEMKIEGKLLDRSEFDWSKYEGKVVLVDFWATWCGPCLEELPNVLKNYALYHEKGFEVVGISLDDDPQQLHRFVATREIPWPILFSGKEGETGYDHPMALKYGVVGLPAPILVGKDGKVITVSARGPALGQHLQDLLGDPVSARTDQSITK